jgi:hypothetical protein
MALDAQRMAALYAAEIVDDLEEWARDHAEVTRCWEVEDKLRVLNAFLDVVLRAESRRRDAIPLWEQPPDMALEARVKRALRRVDRACARVERAIRRLEGRSYAVEGADDFRRNRIILRMQIGGCGKPRPRPVRVEPDGRLFELTGEQIVFPGLEPEKIRAGLEDVEAGRTRPLEDILAERKAKR